MKLADRVVDVRSKGVAQANQFNIAQTSKMFKILSDSLYSDKIMAAIRELSTNAYDSHIASNNPHPFLVHLPNQADPNFMVRDYGTGLSQEDMENLYTTYGASNKNTSNDFVGCLGLGSKSPFAYTKSFTTSSYYNGKKYSYVAAIDESGVPTLSLFSITPTSEPNGLEISFAVKQHDFSEFTNKAKRIYHYFKIKPTITGGVCGTLSGHRYSNRNIVLSGDGWRVCSYNNDSSYFPTSYSNVDSPIVAIMGNIAYPVYQQSISAQDMSQSQQNEAIAAWNKVFGKSVSISSWDTFIRSIGGNNYLELDFEIGEIEMDPSREGLQYTKDVINKIRQKTHGIYLELEEKISKKIASATSKLDAIRKFNELSDLNSNWITDASWTDANGSKHKIDCSRSLTYKLPKDKAMYVLGYKSQSYRSKKKVYQTDSIYADTLKAGPKLDRWGYTTGQSVSGEVAFFNCDIKTIETAKNIALKYTEVNNCYAYLLIDTQDQTKSLEGFDELIKDIGGQEKILNVSDYRDLVKKQRTAPTAKRGRVSDQDIFLIINNTVPDANVTPVATSYADAQFLGTIPQSHLDELDEQDMVVYVPMLRYSSVDGYPTMRGLNNCMASPLFKDINVYAVKQSKVKELIDDGVNMVDVNDYLLDKVKDLAQNDFKDIYSYSSIMPKTDDNIYADRTLLNTFRSQILNIFGLDYHTYIKNTHYLAVMDILMFSDFMEYSTSSIVRSKEYCSLMDSISKNLGLNIDTATWSTKMAEFTSIKGTIVSMYGGDSLVPATMKAMLKLDSSGKNAIKLPTMSSLESTLSDLLDKAPALKYTMLMGWGVTNTVDRHLRDNHPFDLIGGARYFHLTGKQSKWVKDFDIGKLRQGMSCLFN